MDARVLRYFLAVAREGSITAAANFLHITQPTLSRQIRELEEELSVRLFVRHSHSVSLTADGMRLRKRAEEIVDMFEKARAEFSNKHEDIAGEIYIGGGETRAMRHIAALVRALREKHPGIRVHLWSGNSEDVTERLDKGLLDFGILLQPADLGKYDSLPLPEKEVWGVILRRDSKLAALPRITRQDLMGEPLILSRQAIRQTSSRNAFLDWFQGDFDALNIAATFNLVYNAAILARSGVGHVLSLDGLVDVSNESELCFRLLEPRLETGLDVVWKKNQLFSPAAEGFLTELKEKFSPPSENPAPTFSHS